MFDRKFITNAIDRSSETGVDRRNFLAAAGLGVGAAVLAPAIGLTGASSAEAASTGISDATILNFALNLEYLEAEFYLRAVTGQGLSDAQVTGKGTPGAVTGGRQVTFETKAIQNYATEIAADEKAHVLFLRSALGGAAVSRPAIDIEASFTAAARAAGVVGPDETFDPYENEVAFLIGAFIFEDLGVTAYKGAAPLIQNKTYLEAAAGILAVEAYHAGIVRSNLYALEQFDVVQKISDARDSLDGTATDLDQGIGTADVANLVPTDPNGVVFSRSPGQVLNVAYLTNQAATQGGFYPAGINSDLLKSSAASA